MIRSFILHNNQGEALDLLDQDLFGHDPEGLGVIYDNTYVASETNFIHTNAQVQQGVFSLKLLVGNQRNDAYMRFANLARFLSSPPYTLAYTTDAGTYRRDCVLNELTKTEISIGNAMVEEISLEFITPWYVERVVSTSDDKERFNAGYYGMNYVTPSPAGIGIVYGGDYPIYGAGASQEGIFLTLSNDSQGHAPAIIEFSGESENPIWEVYVGSRIVQSDGYFINTAANDRVVVSSYPQSQRAQWYTGGQVNNIYLAQDITRTNFVRIPPGESLIAFRNIRGRVTVTYRVEVSLV